MPHPPKLSLFRNFNLSSLSRKRLIYKNSSGFLTLSDFRDSPFDGAELICCFKKGSVEAETLLKDNSGNGNGSERPPFDINLAVILAGFAFEAYTSPPEDVGRREIDAADCQTVFLSESFIREIYDGQLFIKIKKGVDLPAMDPWGTSDPYVVLQLESQVVRTQTKWGTKEPTWNEEFALNIKQTPSNILQVAAWDANLVTPHKRMGNAGVNLDSLCDGNSHEVLIDLEGMGGGGKIMLEIKYKSFDKIEEEKKGWRIPIISEFLDNHGFESAMKTILGSETVQASQFVNFAFGQLKTLNNAHLPYDMFLSSNKDRGSSSDPSMESGSPDELSSDSKSGEDNKQKTDNNVEDSSIKNEHTSSVASEVREASESDRNFWSTLSTTVNQNIVQKFGIPAADQLRWDGFDILNKFGLQSQKYAEAGYIESGLATTEKKDNTTVESTTGPQATNMNQLSIPDMKKMTQDVLKQTDAVLGALMVVNATVSQFGKEAGLFGKNDDVKDDPSAEGINSSGNPNALSGPSNALVLDEKKAEEMRALFTKAESAMEAWAMLATSLGHPSFIKSEFEKICFLDNSTTDTQVALWRDSSRKRLVVAFRGTEQAKWKDLRTDLMIVPAGLNPERIGGDFKQEVQVHSGFLNAYDSVRSRIIRLIKQVVAYTDEGPQPEDKWQVYVTGHSLGGALATLLALELSSSQLSRRGTICVTMYNFGSPRVGNKKFAEVYNEKVKDSWRVVNHRDIIPTVPRLMGYCHVAQPVYLAAGDLENALANVDLMRDGYQGDVLGESTPDVIVSEFMKGEKELIEKILNTEINIFRAIRDGSALMQHMEDFYYVTLLECVRCNYQNVATARLNESNNTSVG